MGKKIPWLFYDFEFNSMILKLTAVTYIGIIISSITFPNISVYFKNTSLQNKMMDLFIQNIHLIEKYWGISIILAVQRRNSAKRQINLSTDKCELFLPSNA